MRKMKSLFVVMFMFLALGLINIAGAQTDTDSHVFDLIISPVALLHVESSFASLSVTAPEYAGEDVEVSPADSNTYLQYTSVVAAGTTRRITLNPSNNFPAGIILYCTPLLTETGEGDRGDTRPTVYFDIDHRAAKVIIDDIGSCFTEDGSTDGANLTYWIEVDDIGNINAATTSITLTYTLTDDLY
jgi:hypothetical protein